MTQSANTSSTTHTGPGESRESFMARVRVALKHDKTQRPTEQAPVADQAISRLARMDDDLVAMFTERAAVVGMKVYPATSSDLMRQIVGKLKELQSKKLVIGAGSLPQALGLKDTLRRNGFEIIDWAASPNLDVQFDSDAGITDVHAALAETGTLVCCSDQGHSRGLSLVPPIHIAIVRKSDILPDMFDYWARQSGIPGAQLPSSIVFITGPSKTADIEGELIKGVHGPKEVHIFLVGDA